MGYKLVSYRAEASGARAGVLVEDSVYDAARITGQPSYADMLGVLADWNRARRVLARAAKRVQSGQSRAKGAPLKRTRLLAPVLYPGMIFCAGANYTDHVAEMARASNRPPEADPRSLGLKPWHFIKTSRSSVVGPGSAVKLPAYSKMVDWEIELVAVIGRAAKNVPVERALECVAGYTIGNDLSARDAMKREGISNTSPFHYDWISQKCFDGAAPLGPWIVPANEISDPQNLAMKLWVNDQLMQDSITARMIFNTAEQIAQLSSRVRLHPGDLVFTGTPAGVGAGRGVFLKAGDSIRMWIEGIGELAHTVVAQAPAER